MAEVEIQPKAPWRNILTVTASAGPVPPAGTAILELDGPHELTSDDGVWVSNVNGITGINENLEQAITVLSPTSVSLDTAPSISGTYTGGGIFRDDRVYTHRIENSNRRPLSIGGALYYVMYYLPGSERVGNLGDFEQARIYKSTDNGASWTHMDAANAPKAEQLGSAVQGSTIWVSYSAGGKVVAGNPVEDLRVQPFDTATDTWGTVSPVGPDGDPPGANCFPVPMADGRILLYHEGYELAPGSLVNESRRPAWSVFNPGTGLWDSLNNVWSVPNNTVTGVAIGSPPEITASSAHGYYTGTRITIAGVSGVTNVNGSHIITVTGASTFTLNGVTSTGTYTGGGTTHAEPQGSGAMRIAGVVAGEGDLIHFFYGININEPLPARAYLFHRSFNQSTLVLVGDEQTLTADATSRFNGCSVPLAYSRAGATNLFLVATFQLPSTQIDKMEQLEAVSAINPVWSRTDGPVSADFGSNPGGLIDDPEFSWADAAYNAATDELWFFWSKETGTYANGDSRLGISYSKKIPGSSWESEVVWKSDPTYSYGGAAPAVVGADVLVIYAKLRPEEIHTNEFPLTVAENFPHIDIVVVCPPPAGVNRAFFFGR